MCSNDKKGAAISSTFVWIVVFPAMLIFMFFVLGAAIFLAAEKSLGGGGNEVGLVDLRGYESAENFLNQEVDGMKTSEFIVYSIANGDLGKVSGKDDIRDSEEVNRDFRAFEVKIKKILNELPKPVKISAWTIIIKDGSLGIEKVIRGGGSVYQEGDSVPLRERVYDSKVYLDKDLSLEFYLECQEVFCSNV